MKLLKLTLSDKKTYTLCTFSALEAKVLRKEHRKYEGLQDELDRINFETDEKGKIKLDTDGRWVPRTSELDEDDRKRIEDVEEKNFNFTIDILRKSLSKNHEQFKKVDDKEEDQIINDKTMDLVDLSDLRKITQFAFNGTYENEEDILDYSIPESEDGNAK